MRLLNCLQWSFDQGFICSQIYPSMVFSIKVRMRHIHIFFKIQKNSSEKGGAQLILFNRKDSDNLEQQWYPETYNTFEKSLVTAATAGQLHKKEGFGQPRLGYGAEIGVPPELKVLPANTNIAGLGANIDSNPAPTPTQDVGSYNPSMPENLQGFYPPPTPSQVPTGPPPQADPLAAYPPPLPSSSSYPLPQVLATHHQQHYQKYSGEYTSPSYPPPPPTIPQQNHQNYQGYQGGGAYPPSVGYPPHPSQSSSSPRYPSPPNYPPVPNTHSSNPGGFYRPPTEMPLQGQYLPHGSNSQPPTDPYGYGSPNNNYPPPPRQNSYGGYPSQ
ncbi:hypothetical protein BDF14DRAFT_1849396 [Spinellus fusiger]|nr:hypothetical protein BDF14DRAFT_1849396 [Spinellus fusiger]